MGDFSDSNFDAEEYVKNLTQQPVGGRELQQHRAKILNLSEEVNDQLKKNVYKNYKLFMDTAYEVSHLEGDMYQLSQLLAEQRSSLSSLASHSTLNSTEATPLNAEKKSSSPHQAKSIDRQDLRKNTLSDLADKLEGCIINLTEDSGRIFLHEGELLELDTDNSPIGKVRAFLLSDLLLLTTPVTSRLSPERYKLQTAYDISNLAVVNVKDAKNAFKLLAFPDTRVFHVIGSRAKLEWMEKFEEAKRIVLGGAATKKRNSCVSLEISPTNKSNSVHPASGNPFEVDDDETHDEPEMIPNWLEEVADDIDVLLVERHFEEAYDLIDKARNYVENRHSSDFGDIKSKLDSRVQTLIEMLTSDLELRPNKSNQGGVRAALRSVKLLNTMNLSSQACDLFLKLCTNFIKSRMKGVKRESAGTVYVQQLSSVFFSNFGDIVKVFQFQAFPSNKAAFSELVIWCNREINAFMASLVRHVFFPQTPLSVLAQCISTVRTHCSGLSEIGLDLIYLIEGHLRMPLKRALLESREKYMEIVKQEIVKEKWHPSNLRTKKERDNLLSEFKTLGLQGIEKYNIGDCFTQLNESSIAFIKTFFKFFDECMALGINELFDDIEQILCDLLVMFNQYLMQSCRNTALQSNQIDLANANMAFFADDFVPFCCQKFEKAGLTAGKLSKTLRQNREGSAKIITVTGYI